MIDDITQQLSVNKYPFPEIDDFILKVLESHFQPENYYYVMRKDLAQSQFLKKYNQIIQQEEFHTFVKYSALHIYLFKIYGEQTANFLSSKLLKNSYFYLFLHTPQPKNEIINFAIIVSGFFIHRILYELFPVEFQNNRKIDRRFVYDIYHVIIYVCNGIVVSDKYIEQQITTYLDDKFMDYQQSQLQKLLVRQNQRKKQQAQKQFIIDKTFLGHKLKFPEITMRKSLERFHSIIDEKLKLRKRVDSQPIIRPEVKQTNEDEANDVFVHTPLRQNFNFQLNLNQVSPSVSDAIQLTRNIIQKSKDKMVSHQVDQSSQNVDEKILDLLRESSQLKQKKTEVNPKPKQLKKQARMIDKFGLANPRPELFEVHPKLDHIFKPMLEMQYVLQNHRENFKDTFSYKNMSVNQQKIPDEFNSSEKIEINKKPRSVRNLLETINESQETIKIYDTPPKIQRKTSLQMFPGLETSMISNIPSTMEDVEKSATLKFKTLVNEPALKNESTMLQSQITTQRGSLTSQGAISPLKNRIKLLKLKPDSYQYKDKRVEYKKKFDKMLQFQDPDTRINMLFQNFQKQNLINKDLQRKIHKMKG